MLVDLRIGTAKIFEGVVQKQLIIMIIDYIYLTQDWDCVLSIFKVIFANCQCYC